MKNWEPAEYDVNKYAILTNVEDMGTIRIWASVGHRKEASLGMLHIEILIFEFVAPD